MKRKLRFLVTLGLIVMIFITSTSNVFAANISDGDVAVPMYTYINTASADLWDNEDDTADFLVTCSGTTSVTKIKIEVVLQKKGLLGIYSDEDSMSKTINKTSGTFSDTFDIDSSKTYRIKVDITVYTATSEESHTMYSDPT